MSTVVDKDGYKYYFHSYFKLGSLLWKAHLLKIPRSRDVENVPFIFYQSPEAREINQCPGGFSYWLVDRDSRIATMDCDSPPIG